MTERLLLTGAAGFIGSHVARTLAGRDGEILGVDNLNEYYDVSLKKKGRLATLQDQPNFRFVKADISDSKSMETVFNDFRPTHIIHLAAQAGVRYSTENPFSYEASNGLGFLTMIEAARRHNVQHFLYASSSSVYGNSPDVPYREDNAPEHPVSFYAATKRYNEHTAAVYTHQYGLKCTGLRFFTVYGPWGRPDMAYFSFTQKIMGGKPITVFDKGQLQRDYTYIDDIVSGILAAHDRASDGHEIYNLGNHRVYTILEMLTILEEALGRKAEIRWAPMQAGDVYKTFADITKSRRDLAYDPKTHLKEGLDQFIAWYRNTYSS